MSVRGAKPKPEPGSAIARIDEAYSRFKDTTSLSDARRFQDTRLKDVWDAAKEVEKELGAKSSYRGLRRLNPLLTGLGHYSDALGILCNGTPYLPWIWVCKEHRFPGLVLFADTIAYRRQSSYFFR